MSVSPNPNPPLPPVEQVGKVIGTIQSAIALIIALSAILTSAGFVIVNSHLAKFTDIHAFNIHSSQYLAAGIGFITLICATTIVSVFIWNRIAVAVSNQVVRRAIRLLVIVVALLVAVIVTLSSGTMEATSLGSGLVLGFVASFVIIGGANYFIESYLAPTLIPLIPQQTDKTGAGSTTNPPRNLKEVVENALRRPLSVEGVSVFIGVLIYTSVIGYLYANSLYGFLPRTLGGGQPTSIVVVVKDVKTLSQIGLSRNLARTNQTQNLLLLADLADGLLVLDPGSGQVVAVKNESILGIVDDKVNIEYLATATPTPTYTPTVVTTPTSTSTPIATTTDAP